MSDIARSSGMNLLAQLEAAGAITPTSLTLPPSITYEQYEALFAMLGQIQESTCWMIGDLINIGEKVYGHTYTQAVDATGLAEQTLMNYSSVCSRIPRERRRAGVKFSLHATIAYLVPDEQDKWLELAARNGWRRRELREAINEAKRITAPPVEVLELSPGPEQLPPAVVCQCPVCGRVHHTDIDVVPLSATSG